MHAAEGYARSTGKVGCVLVTSGPGATNAVTGLTDALLRLDPDRLHHRPGADASDRQRRLPGMRHRRHHAARAPSTITWSRTSPICRACCTRRSISPRAGGRVRSWSTSRRTSSSPRASIRSPKEIAHKGYQPKVKGDLDKIKAAVDLMRTPSGRCSTPAAASSIPAREASQLLRELVQAHRLPDHLDPDGARRLSGVRSAVARHARHARHLGGELGDARLRPDDLHRRALRRPHHRPARRLLAGLEEDPRRHRSVLDQQERQGRRADHRRLRARARGHGAAVARERASARQGGARRLVEADRQVARAQIARLQELERDHQAAIRDRAAL